MNTICDLLISFIEVFAAMSPWLVAGFFAATARGRAQLPHSSFQRPRLELTPSLRLTR